MSAHQVTTLDVRAATDASTNRRGVATFAKSSRLPRATMCALVFTIVASYATAPATLALTPAQRTTDGVVNVLNPELHAFWVATFKNLGQTYTPPQRIIYYNVRADDTTRWVQHPTNCDLVTTDGYANWSWPAPYRYYSSSTWRTGNSFYCPADRTLYLDFNWNGYLTTAYGDNSAGGILAHEYGHHIQALLGWDVWLQSRKEWAAFELQADCYAGLFMQWAQRRGVLAAGDLAEARATLSALGDYSAPNKQGAHGTPEQRAYWFNEGFNTYSVARCNEVYLYS